MGVERVSAATAVLAGLVSFFSPCVFPLIPAYLGYMTGMAAGEGGSSRRLRTLAHALAFVLGFGLVFVSVGAIAGLLGRLIQPILPVLVKVGGLVLIVFGLNMVGLISISALSMEKRIELDRRPKQGLWGSLVVGVVFAAGWTPCVGPVLTAIFTLAADSKTLTTGAVLLALYTLGLGIPFLIVAGTLDALLPKMRKVGRYLNIATHVGGVLLIVMGFLMVTGLFDAVVFWFNLISTPAL